MRFGGLTAVKNFSLDIPIGELRGLIGPNGAGKTTVFNVISGIYKPTAGSVELFGQDITGLRPDFIAYRGIARTFQNIRLFGELTVTDNILVGHHLRRKATLLDAFLSLPKYRSEEKEMRQNVMGLLGLTGLEGKDKHRAGSLSYGLQRRLEIARALASRPRVLLLDEPAAGMNPAEAAALVDLIMALKERFELTIILIEHQMNVVMRCCEHITVLDHGETLAEGTPRDIQENNQVIKAYLGGWQSATN
jgi:branched-chain amino acid transport system ATP-binding protein